MYQIQPKRQNKVAAILVPVLMIGAVVLITVSAFSSSFGGLLQLGAVALFAADVAIFVRYLKKSYVYRLQGFNTQGNAPDFIVSEISGKESVMLCRLSLCDLVGIREKDGSRTESGVKKYNYCVDIAPAGAYCFDFIESGERVTVIITPDEKMLSIFREYLALNIENKQQED